MNNRKGFASAVGILVLAGMVICVGGIWYYKNSRQSAPYNRQREEQKSVSIGSLQNTPTEKIFNQNRPVVQGSSTVPTSPSTSTWKLYRNKEYGFELSYPKDRCIVESGEIKLGKEQIVAAIFPCDYLIDHPKPLQGGPEGYILGDEVLIAFNPFSSYAPNRDCISSVSSEGDGELREKVQIGSVHFCKTTSVCSPGNEYLSCGSTDFKATVSEGLIVFSGSIGNIYSEILASFRISE